MAILALDTTDGPFMYLIFNTTEGPLADPKVRDAIGYAIKREDVMAAAFFNRGAALTGMPLPASSPFYNEEYASHWSYDPEKAKALLAEAGYGDGFQRHAFVNRAIRGCTRTPPRWCSNICRPWVSMWS